MLYLIKKDRNNLQAVKYNYITGGKISGQGFDLFQIIVLQVFMKRGNSGIDLF